MNTLGEVISLYTETRKNHIIVTEELLEQLGESYQNRVEPNTLSMNFEQYVEYCLWKIERNVLYSF